MGAAVVGLCVGRVVVGDPAKTTPAVSVVLTGLGAVLLHLDLLVQINHGRIDLDGTEQTPSIE